MANTIHVVNEPEYGKMYKLEMVMNVLEPNSRRKSLSWRSRLDSEAEGIIQAQITECFTEFFDRDSRDKSAYELIVRIVGRRIDKNGKYCD
jgi:hypothetical protein